MGTKRYLLGGHGSAAELSGSGRRLFLATFLIGLLAICLAASSASALSPSVATQPASSVGDTGATLNAQVNPNGLETKMYFEYGTTTSYGSKTAEVSVGSGSSTLEKGQSISSLTKKTVYHYRVVASNSSGTSFGADRTFTTTAPPEAFTAFLSTVTYPSGEEATLKGSVNPNGQATTYQFEYGTSSGSYTFKAPVPAASAGSGYTSTPVSTTITGLTPGTRYYFRITATSASGTSSGIEGSFLSSKLPAVEILPPAGLWRSQATLSANLDPRTLATTYYFEWGTTTSYGNKTPTGETSSVTKVTEPLGGLAENTEYHYRLVASNSAGTVVSKDQAFTTLSSVSLYAVGGGALAETAPLVASSSNFVVQGRPCSEAKLNGEVEEQPGARQAVTSLEMKSGAAGCEWGGGLSIKYRAASQPVGSRTLEYAKTNAGEVRLRTSPEFLVIGDLYAGGFNVGECLYNFVLSGSTTSWPLEPTLSGNTEFIKALRGEPMYCPPGGEGIMGKFAITSSGSAVEAK